jgi:uncharacterized membrane protein HdeD (DUF308 family)
VTRPFTLATMAVLLAACGGFGSPFSGIRSIFTLIMLVIYIVAIFDVVTGPRSTAAKVGWIAIILLIPVLGVIGYVVLGRPDTSA